MGVRIGSTPFGDWQFQYLIPVEPDPDLEEILSKFQDLPEIDDPAVQIVVTSVLEDATYDLKFLVAAVRYVTAFFEYEAETFQELSQPSLIGLFAALVSVVVNDTVLFTAALKWEQNGRPDISITVGHSELRDACIIISTAAD